MYDERTRWRAGASPCETVRTRSVRANRHIPFSRGDEPEQPEPLAPPARTAGLGALPFALLSLAGDEGEGLARRAGAANLDTERLAPAAMATGEHDSSGIGEARSRSERHERWFDSTCAHAL